MKLKYLIYGMFSFCFVSAEFKYNHPEIDWQTFETEHFQIHFYKGTESTAREGAYIAEQIYTSVTELYDYEPPAKTDLIFTDLDDFSNGAAYYYDNKIMIWASPLDFELRGSHRWLQNVITHEFTHIVSLQKAMKAGMKFPGAYVQWMDYEDEKRQDVLYGFPQKLVSYPLPGTTVPPWLAEGTAQYMYEDATWDNWDSHRDMILRDRALHDQLLTFTEMNTFGKKGIGNESTYNAGYALCRYIADHYGAKALKNIISELSNPLQFSISNAIKKAIGIDGIELYQQFKKSLELEYQSKAKKIFDNEVKGEIIIDDGTGNFHPKWSPDGKKIALISNRDNDYLHQTDLYLYDVETKQLEKLDEGALFAPNWHPSGKVIYYTKKPPIPNKHGSRFFDIYEYNLETEKVNRLTEFQRAFNPVFLDQDSSIAFLSSFDGGQNIYKFDIKSKRIVSLTNFDDHSILRELSYDPENNRLLFNRTVHHYRNVYEISLADLSVQPLLNNNLWDERDASFQLGKLIHADDRSGIFNIRINDQNYVTNVTGGAFMADLNQQGEIVYSLYEKGKYNIALLTSPASLQNESVGYSHDHFIQHSNHKEPMVEQLQNTSRSYTDDFNTMFILPRVMLDYETVKPGFYFYSSEILERLNVFGGASMNAAQDVDLFFIFEFNRLYPTLFADVFYLTRNVQQSNFYSVYKLDDNLKFRLTQFNTGIRFPLWGITQMELFSSWQVFRAFIKESVPTENLQAGLAYDYYKGWLNGLKWDLNNVKPLSDADINPSRGYSLDVAAVYEKNDFISGLDLSDAGTLVAKFDNNNTWRMELNSAYYLSLPFIQRWTLGLQSQLGWLSNENVDPFFHFFGGGMVGLKGYPFYSIEGTRKWINDLTFRIPIFNERHIPFGWMILQNGVLGFVYQIGNTWEGPWDKNKLLRSYGIQWRFNGFSFYNFPTAFEMELHRGLDTFTREIDEQSYTYGNDNRFYLKLLFGF